MVTAVSPPPLVPRYAEMGRATRVTPPYQAPVDLCEIQSDLRLGREPDPENDQRILALLLKAAAYVEDSMKLSLMQQTWQISYDWRFPEVVELRFPPVSAVSSVEYIDTTGAEQTLDAADYALKATGTGPARLVPAFGKSWPATGSVPEAVTATYVTGHATAAEIPLDIQQAVKSLAIHWFEHPEAATEDRSLSVVPLGFEGVVERYRAPTLA